MLENKVSTYPHSSPPPPRYRAPWTLLIVTALLLLPACGRSSSETPVTPAPVQSRIISLGGTLNFGNVTVGTVRNDGVLIISNDGNATLTVSGIVPPAGGAYSLTWKSGAIPPGASQSVGISFAPSVAQNYSGIITVNGDQTSGSNTIAVSSVGMAPATTFTLSGRVTDGTSGGFLPNVGVAIIDGANAGKGTTTDAMGRYTLGNLLPGTMTVQASNNGYVAQNTTVAVTTADATQDFVLQRVPAPQGPCTYQLTSPVTVTFGSAGGSDVITFTLTGGGCTWTASATTPSWLHVLDMTGTGNITIRLTVDPNTDATNRQGVVQVRWPGPQAGQDIFINQAAPTPVMFSLNLTLIQGPMISGPYEGTVTGPNGFSCSLGFLQPSVVCPSVSFPAGTPVQLGVTVKPMQSDGFFSAGCDAKTATSCTVLMNSDRTLKIEIGTIDPFGFIPK
jgi:hypothetical protein